MKSLAIIALWFVMNSLALHPDFYMRFEADNSMFTDPPLVEVEEQADFFEQVWNNFFHERSKEPMKKLTSSTIFPMTTFATSPSPSSPSSSVLFETPHIPMETQQSAYSSAKPRGYIIYLVVYVLIMLILFVFLSNINRSCYRKATTQTFQHIDMDIDYGLECDSVAVLEIPTNTINTSKAFYIPGYGKQLSIVREVSQETDF
uniref:Uncharacterized protein n=1 Tax=Caenorhabditis tropicalis TaxID=1561998 RepID=A0A1I7TID3_9PELO